MTLIARWDIISYCNLKCIHCRSEEFYSEDRQISPTLAEAFDLIDTLKRRGVNELNILGGEPFAYRYLREVILYARDQQLEVSITTNGTLLDDVAIEWVVNSGLRQITFSLDGSCPEINDRIRGPGVYEAATRTLAAMLRCKQLMRRATPELSLPLISINCVLTRVNLDDIANIARYAVRIGVDVFRVSPLDMIGNARHHAVELRVSIRDQLALAEQLMPIVAENPQITFSILDLKPLVMEYLYHVTGVPLDLTVSGCRACTDEIYVQPLGLASPCLATARQSEYVKDRSVANYVKSVIELPVLHDGNGFQEFLAVHKRDRAAYSSYVPCNTCAYAGTLCRPCPIKGALEESPVQEMCMIARELLEAQRSSIENRAPVTSSSLATTSSCIA